LAEALASANRLNVSEFRYAALRRYLAKRFHPDYAPGHGIEKVVRNEIFKEIWRRNRTPRLSSGTRDGAIIFGDLIAGRLAIFAWTCQ